MALHRHTQHRHKVRGGGQHYKDVPHLMKAEHARFEVEDLGDAFF